MYVSSLRGCLPAENKPRARTFSNESKTSLKRFDVSKRVDVDRQLTLVDILDGDLSRAEIKSSNGVVVEMLFNFIGAKFYMRKYFEKRMVSIIRIRK